MPKRSSKRKDTNETAFSVMQQATGQAEKPVSDKNPAAVALGRLGGKKGGRARAAQLSAERRSEIARRAAAARWAREDDGED